MRVAKIAASMIVLLVPLAGLVIARVGLGDPKTRPAASSSQLLLKELNAEPLNPPLPVSDFSLRDATGKRISLSDLRGRVVLLNFWATWCPSCLLEMPSMEALNEELGNTGLVILAVNVREGVGEVKAFFQEHKLSFPAILDEEGEVFARFNVWSLPTTLLINKKGELIGKIIGYRDWHSEQTIRVLRRLLENPA